MRQGCHLCDQARPYLVRAAKRLNVSVVEIDIDTDPDLVAHYGLRVPVILGAHDTVLAEGVIDDVRLLTEALKAEINR
jgi:thiol-disulfide isomerase/thioredoxin